METLSQGCVPFAQASAYQLKVNFNIQWRASQPASVDVMLFKDRSLDPSHETEVRGLGYMHLVSGCRQQSSFRYTQNVSVDATSATHRSEKEPEVGEGKDGMEKPEDLSNVLAEVS